MSLTKEEHMRSHNNISRGYYTNEDILNYKKLIKEHFRLIEKFEQLDKDYDKFYDKSLIQIAELKGENKHISQQLIECQIVCNEKQLMIDELKKTLNENIYKIFSNPPLKFEELKENMWVWDNLYKDYVKLKRHDIENFGKLIIFSKGFDEEHLRKFEENRFYRREVE